jgi:hypothetical protein
VIRWLLAVGITRGAGRQIRRIKALCVAIFCAVVFAAVGVGAASAGEVTGPFPNGTPL